MFNDKINTIESRANEMHDVPDEGAIAVKGAIERASDTAQNAAHKSDWDQWSGDWDKWQDSHRK